ncbi:MAG: MopE-related protein [Myxococcota bacterium]
MWLALSSAAFAQDVLFADVVDGVSVDASGASTLYDGSSTLTAGDDLVVQIPTGATVTDVYLVLLPTWGGFVGDPAADVAVNGVPLSSATLESASSDRNVYTLDPATFGITGSGAYDYEETGAADSSYYGATGVSGAVLAVFYDDPVRTGRRYVWLGLDDVIFGSAYATGLPTAGTMGEVVVSAGIWWQCADEQDAAIAVGTTLLSSQAGGRDDGKDYSGTSCRFQDWNSLLTMGSFGVDDTDTVVGTDGDEVDAAPAGTSDDSRLDDELWQATYDQSGSLSYTYFDFSGDSILGVVAMVFELDSDEDGIRDADDTCDGGTGTEVCFNGTDDDCDGDVDEGDAVDATVFYADADGDGHGDPAVPYSACDLPSGYATAADDCDDADAAVNPDAVEACNEIDDDCDGAVDEPGATGESTWYTDADGDGFGDAASTVTACDRPDGAIEDATDCDDADPATNPGAGETWYDGVDQDCDGNDTDQDEDGFDAEVVGGDDCDDLDSTVYPGAPDAWYDGEDDDCAGNGDYDADGDGHDSESYQGDDCDDARADVYPGAPDEPYDGEVTDCDDRDEFDQDGDGYTAESGGGDDCDDSNSEVNPGAEEVWYDGIDQDCDLLDDDQDRDGWAVDNDCDDTDPELYPGAPGYDVDCEPIVEDTSLEEEDEEDPLYKGGGGCGCGVPGSAGSAVALLAAAGLLVGRRRRLA